MNRVLATGSAVALLAGAAFAGPPVTKKVPVTDTYHGVTVTDYYRWLEDGDDEAVRNWSDEQNVHARKVLDGLPHVDEIRSRLTEIMTAKTVSYGSLAFRGWTLFAMKREPPKQQPFLVAMQTADKPYAGRVVLDPNKIDPSGTTTIDWYVPSPDGGIVAVSLSEGGSESGDVHIYNATTLDEIRDVVPRVNGGTAGGDVAWSPDGLGFYYTRYPRKGERAPEDMDFYQQVYYHTVGIPTRMDRYEIGKDFPRIAEIQLDMNRKTGYLIATVQDGDGGRFAHYLRSPDGKWRQFSVFGDKIVQAAFGSNDELFLVSRQGAPRGKILRMGVDELDASKAKTIIPEGKDTIQTSFMSAATVVSVGSRLYVVYQKGGPSEIRVFDREGKPLAAPKQLPVSSVYGITKLRDEKILFGNTSFIDPPAYYSFDPETGETSKTRLATKSVVDFDDVKVVREFAVSKDGTKVPVNIIMPESARLDGTNPCVVTGYGGYGVSLAPRFSSTRRVLLDQGAIYVVANLRGGGEFGEEWHLQGNLTNKQNVFDDFAAVLRHLIDRKYTSASKIAIIGGSNGGLLMGATMVQHPELVKAVVSYVGIYDMLRVELSPNGAFNIPEFGTVTKPDHFKALLAYSPYHNVKDGASYPPVLFLTGANDPRVDPMQSRKMTARLQEASGSDTPVLLRTSSSSGHGGDTSLNERIEQTVDAYAFMFAQLGVDFSPGKARSGH